MLAVVSWHSTSACHSDNVGLRCDDGPHDMQESSLWVLQAREIVGDGGQAFFAERVAVRRRRPSLLSRENLHVVVDEVSCDFRIEARVADWSQLVSHLRRSSYRSRIAPASSSCHGKD